MGSSVVLDPIYFHYGQQHCIMLWVNLTNMGFWVVGYIGYSMMFFLDILAKSSHLRLWTRLQLIILLIIDNFFLHISLWKVAVSSKKRRNKSHTCMMYLYSFSATLWGYLHLCIWQMLIQRNYNSIKVYIYIRSVHWDSYCFNLMKTEVHASSV